MTLRIYGDPRSGNCLKVKWVAEHLEIAHEWVDVDVLTGATRTPRFLAMNPAGQVPTVILDDGRPLAQSNAIMVHLAEGSDLIPTGAYDRARMFEWLFWEQYSHEPYIAVVRFQVALLGKAVDEVEARLIERGHAALQRLEDGLAASPFLVGERVSLADVACVAYTRLAHEGGFDLAAYPKVRDWVGRVERALGIS
ncbi:MAG TPA: glutathione S-transferase family protein [Caulobacteraceae bacterium]